MRIDTLRQKADVELREELENLREDCFKRQYRSGSDETEERGKVIKLRREIARILTLLRERELGLQRGRKKAPSGTSQGGPARRSSNEGGKE